MKKLLTLLLILSANTIYALPFNDDMVDNQITTGQVMLPAPENSVAKGSLQYGPRTKEEALKLQNPTKPRNKNSIAKGKRLFEVNCAACHGEIGKEQVVYPAGKFLGAPNLADPLYHDRTDGSMYSTIHFGNVIMYPVGWKISVEETWDIINYIRDTQRKYPQAKPAKNENQTEESN